MKASIPLTIVAAGMLFSSCGSEPAAPAAPKLSLTYYNVDG